MSQALPLRIFIASPGDLGAERELVSSSVRAFNADHGEESQISFEVVGWERVRGTARRPQEAINELIGESHFLIALFKRSWGSEPGSPWGYTSGTEEELFTGLLELGQDEQPMRDVWVGFIADADPHSFVRVRVGDKPDADPHERVRALQAQMADTHSLLYESIANSADLTLKLGERLLAWARMSASKTPRHVNLRPSSGRDVLRAANLRVRGEKLVDLGQHDAGETSLREAADLGGPDEKLAFSKFLARNGNFDEALIATDEAIGFYSNGMSQLHSPAAAEAFAAQAGILRRQRKNREAIGRLQQALTLVHDADAFSKRVRSRILDEIGLAHQAIGELDAARDSFQTALALRREMGAQIEESQSLINIARLELVVGSADDARRHASQAIFNLSSTPPSGLRANAEALVAQVLLAQGHHDDAATSATNSLILNQQIASKHGEAIALYILAQCHAAAGNTQQAIEKARECVAVNESMGNGWGSAQAQAIIDALI